MNFKIVAKLCHEVREAPAHAFLLSRRRAVAKIALFMRMLQTRDTARNGGTDEIYTPTARSDIATYVGRSPEAVSRAFRDLVASGAIAFRNRRQLKMINGAILDAVISETSRKIIGHAAGWWSDERKSAALPSRSA